MFVFLSHLTVPDADHARLERRSLEATQDVLTQRLRPDEAACALPVLQTALASLSHAPSQ